jgi:ribonuclease HII
MAKATSLLRLSPGLLLVDGNRTIPPETLAPRWQARHTAPLPDQRAIVDGDRDVEAISAASILAKTFRDRLMVHLDRRWPGYGFARHKGYGTKEHYAAIRKLGPCPQHRLTFAGVRPKRTVQPSLF